MASLGRPDHCYLTRRILLRDDILHDHAHNETYCLDNCYEPSSEQRGILTTAQHVARSTTACMLDDLANEQCSTCLTTSRANNARVRHARQRAKRAMLDMLDNEHSEQGGSPLVYRSPKHDFLMNRVQLILSLDLLLRLPKLQTLVTK